ncbi:monovalent cation/H+ antiporter complex subunit F [Ferrimonas sp. SCSIO 43195]|uniref:monovalent cation/H+ antiporter complex subunit F n=1 Tax=Ferrimonas sp. SCSIO 43195 TaxID=2822844 RepID=UPI002074DB57|nr:monovalent cation/H+ antiporter complex subunit F [Ferrimonas sp. SCSIO 43195]USD36457.1 pH regulation protein F [Ferrimonas sp. SCSIO 43195]
MQIVYLSLVLVLLINLVVGMWRVVWGPTAADRMLSVQLLGTSLVAILLILAQALGHSALVDVALVFALLSAVTAVAFVRSAWRTKEQKNDPH